MPEIVGWDEIVGDDGEDEEVGASPREVKARDLPKSFVGIPRTAFTAGQRQTTQVPIQRSLRPDRLVFDRTDAASIDVYDVRVGTVSLNASVNPVPGDMFAPDAVGTSIRAVETATPSVGIQIDWSNKSAGPLTFGGGFIGPSMKASA